MPDGAAVVVRTPVIIMLLLDRSIRNNVWKQPALHCYAAARCFYHCTVVVRTQQRRVWWRSSDCGGDADSFRRLRRHRPLALVWYLFQFCDSASNCTKKLVTLSARVPAHTCSACLLRTVWYLFLKSVTVYRTVHPLQRASLSARALLSKTHATDSCRRNPRSFALSEAFDLCTVRKRRCFSMLAPTPTISEAPTPSISQPIGSVL